MVCSSREGRLVTMEATTFVSRVESVGAALLPSGSGFVTVATVFVRAGTGGKILFVMGHHAARKSSETRRMMIDFRSIRNAWRLEIRAQDHGPRRPRDGI